MKSYLQELAIQQEFNISKDGPIIERPKIKETKLKESLFDRYPNFEYNLSI